MNIDNQRIRIAVDTSQMGSLMDVITGNTPQFWNGVDLQFELAFFYGANLLSVSNIDSITIDLKASDPRTGLPLMSQTIASGALNQSLTLAEWQTGNSASCHALIVFTNSETNLDLNADTETFWLSISALTADSPAHKLELGAGPLNVVEGGEGVEPPASVVQPLYYTGAQSDARYTMAVNLTSLNNGVATLNSEVAALQSEMTSVTTTANAALPLAGGTMTGAIIFTGTGYAAITLNSLTTTQRNALTAAAGNLLFNSTTGAVEYYNGTLWSSVGSGMFVPVAGGAMTGPLTFTGTTNPGLTASNLTGTQIAALTPAEGMVVFNTTSDQLQVYNGSAWVPLALARNIFTVASQAAMLALSANQGDIAVRTDLNQCFVLANSAPATLSNWVQLLTPSSAVQSVNSLTGAITLTTSNIGEGSNLYFTTARAQTAAIAALLTGFTNAAGGDVSASDSVVVAIGRLENRMEINDAKADGSNRVLRAGDTMTGPLQFSGSGNAGLVLASLTDTQRAALTPSNGMIIYNSTIGEIEIYNGTSWVVLSTGSSTSWYAGSGAPSSSVGSSGAYYLNTANGSIYLNISGSWGIIWSPSSLAGSYLPLTGGTMTGAVVFTGTTFAGITLNSVTTTQRNALTAAAGNLVFNTTTGLVEYYNGSAWGGIGSGTYLALSGGTLTGPLSFSGTTNSGLKLSNLTSTQIAALTPAAGMTVFNTTTGVVQYYNGSAWVTPVSTGAAPLVAATDATTGYTGGTTTMIAYTTPNDGTNHYYRVSAFIYVATTTTGTPTATVTVSFTTPSSTGFNLSLCAATANGSNTANSSQIIVAAPNTSMPVQISTTGTIGTAVWDAYATIEMIA